MGIELGCSQPNLNIAKFGQILLFKSITDLKYNKICINSPLTLANYAKMLFG